MSSRRAFLKTGAAVSGTIGLAGCLDQFTGGGTTTLRLGHAVGSEFLPIGTYSARIADRIESETDGQVTIEVFPGGELGTSAEHVEGVSEGTIDMTVEPHDLLASKYGVLAFPFLYEDYQEMMARTSPNEEGTLAYELNQTSIEESSFRALTYLPTGNRTAQLTGEPACVPADLEGRTIRAPESQYFISMIEGLGAETTSIDFSEVPTALSTGSIDGIEFYVSVTQSAGLFEQIDAISRTNHTQYPMVVGINEGTWQGLTDDQQQLLLDVTEAERQTSAERLVTDEEEVLAAAEDQGIEVVGADGCLDREAFRERCQANMFDAFPDWESQVERLRQE
jgi:TRAP-type C4-dicarboxylate transport system substrate-binding protein